MASKFDAIINKQLLSLNLSRVEVSLTTYCRFTRSKTRGNRMRKSYLLTRWSTRKVPRNDGSGKKKVVNVLEEKINLFSKPDIINTLSDWMGKYAK